MRRSRGSRLLVGLLVAGACVPLFARGIEQGVYRAAVDVVLVDVTVVDRAAQPVSDLTVDDFKVTVDRKPRPLASVQFLSHAVRLPSGVGPRASAPAARSRPHAARARGRDVLIVVDEDSMPAGTGLLARRAVEKFLDRLAPEDRVGIAAIPRPRASIALTTSRSDVRKALGRIVPGAGDSGPGAYWIGVSEAFDVERNDETALKKLVDRECRGSYPDRIDMHCVKDVLAEARHVAVQAHLRGQRSIDALRQLSDGLGQIEGPKTMVLVSGGLPAPETGGAYSRLADAFARAQVTLYTVYVEGTQWGGARARQSPTPTEDDRVESEGVENVTSSAGGSLLRAVGSLDAFFDRVATELAGSYLLGIEVAPGDRDGKPHFVEVTTARAGLDVRARRQYVIPRASAAAAGGFVAGPVTEASRPRAAEAADARAKEVLVTSPEVEEVVLRAARYVADYETRFSGLVAEERYRQTLSKWKSRGAIANREVVDRGEWAVDATRELRADYLLVKAPEVAGWIPFRDVFEVDGRKVRERDERLQKLFLEAPASAHDRANEILDESARYNIGYTRNTNLPTLALMFLHPSNRDRFVFWKTGEEVIDGTPAWQVDYRERSRPTLVRNGDRDLPAQGTFWIDPAGGRVLRTAVRLVADAASVETIVTYARNARLDDTLVPVGMRETSILGEAKVECLAVYTNFRRFQVTTDVQIPK